MSVRIAVLDPGRYTGAGSSRPSARRAFVAEHQMISWPGRSRTRSMSYS
jgi:hypothetical protein